MGVAAETIAHALGGHKHAGYWTAQCPAHDDRSPSLSIRDSRDGKILVHCHAGCNQLAVIEALRDRGLWPEREKSDPQLARDSNRGFTPGNPDEQAAKARRIWRESCSPCSIDKVAAYLAMRGLPDLPADAVERTLRFHERCPFGGEFVPALVARYSPIAGDLEPEAEPTAIHRIRLDRFTGSGRKLSLGPSAGQCVKLSPDEDMSLGLGIVEGIEDGLSILASGWAPVWALTRKPGANTFPPLAGIEALTIFADRDANGEGQKHALACKRAWGDRATILLPPPGAKDWNEAWRAAS